MRHETLTDAHFEPGGRGQVARDFGGAVAESGAEFIGVRRLGWCTAADGVERLTVAEFVQVTDGEFEDVGLLQFSQVFTLRRQGGAHEFLEFVQAPVDPGSPLTFQQRFRYLFVEHGARYGFFLLPSG